VFIHDQFVFLEMRKTGSTYLVDALQRELPSGIESPLGKHAAWWQIPSEASGRPVLAYTRNPWDWYVSWHHFNLKQGGAPNGFWRALSAQGALGFAETARKAVTLGTTIMGADLYSTLFRNLVGEALDSELLTIGRFETLFDDLESFLTVAGVELPDGAMARIRAGSPLNASEHGLYRDYYDDELRDLVGDSCRPLIERFSYEF
jgi:hypothetical protein